MRNALITCSFLFLLAGACRQPAAPEPPETLQRSEHAEKLQIVFHHMVRNGTLPMDSVRFYYASIREVKPEQPALKAQKELCEGMYHRRNYAYLLAKLHFQNALSKLKPKDSLAFYAYTGLASVYSHTGDFPAALKNLQDAQTNCEARADTLQLASIQAKIASLYFEKLDTQKARIHINQVLDQYADPRYIKPYLISLHTLANLEGAGNHFEEAMALDLKGLALCKQFNEEALETSFQDNLARCYLYYLKDYAKARYYFEENLKIDRKLNNLTWVADSYINLADVAAAEGNDAAARAYIDQAISIFKETKDLNNALKAYSLLIDIYARRGDYKNAYLAQVEYQKVYKNSFNEKSEQFFAEYNALFETAQKEKALADTQLRLAKEASASRQKNIWLLVFGFVIVISLVLAVNVRTKLRLRQKKLELEKRVLQEQNLLQIQNQRLELARDLHDSMGAQLGFMSTILGTLKATPQPLDAATSSRLEALSDCAATSIAELRSTLWALSSESIDLEDLKIKILNFVGRAERAQPHTQIHLTFDVAQNRTLETKQAVSLFRVIQEIISNALRHAQAKDIWVAIGQNEAQLAIRIADNGNGFDLNSQKDKCESFGLANIRRRVEEVNGDLKIDTGKGAGTTYNIDIQMA